MYILIALAALFGVLKLCGIIHWSWWLVASPVWGAVAAILGVATITLLDAPVSIQERRKVRELWIISRADNGSR